MEALKQKNTETEEMILFKGDKKKEKVVVLFGKVNENPKFKNYFLIEGDRVRLEIFDLMNFVKLTLHLRKDQNQETKVLRLWSGTELIQGKFFIEHLKIEVFQEENDI